MIIARGLSLGCFSLEFKERILISIETKKKLKTVKRDLKKNFSIQRKVGLGGVLSPKN